MEQIGTNSETSNLPDPQPRRGYCCSLPGCKNNPSLYCLAVFLVLIILSSVIDLYRHQNQVPVPAQVVVDTAATPTNNPTTNWKIYTNIEYGFQTKYDSNLNLTEDKGNSETTGQFTHLQTIRFGTGIDSLNYFKGPHGYEIEINKKSLGDYRTEIIGHIADIIDSEKEVVINGNSWTMINYKIFITADYVPITKAVVNRNKHGYAVTAATDDINQILSTFKFTQ